jgi:hypothetical protein
MFLRLKDRAADQFWDLGDDGVAECAQSVCPVGYPMNCSPNSGVGITPLHAIAWAQFIKPSTPPFEILRNLDACNGGRSVRIAVAVRVGKYPQPIPLVRETNGARRYAMPLRVMPDLGQVSENSAHPPIKQRCHVLHDCVARSYQANGSYQFPPESRTLTGKSGASTGEADVLARKTSCNDISHSFAKLHRGNIVVARHSRPMLRQHAAAERVNLAKRYRLKPARTFQAKAEAAYT